MDSFIWYGTLIGAAIGAIHCIQFLVSQLGQTEKSTLQTIWHALWLWGLWTLFGAYLLAFWLMGFALLLVARPFGRVVSAR